jgi:recombination associated protein RdgC
MWFNNALIYQCELNDPSELNTFLSENHLKPCPPHARFIYGWLPVMGEQLVHEMAGASLICLGKEERLLPRGVVNRMLGEQIEALEAQRGYAVKRSEKSQLAEELEFQLLPKAFCLQKRLPALFDSTNKRLIINSASPTQAAQLTSLLRKSIPSIHIEPLDYAENTAARLTTWVTHPDTLPPAFQLASSCLLIDLNNEKKRFQCKGYELPADEVLTLLAQGLAVAELSLIWQDRIEFTLTHDFIFKRIKCLDYLVDEFQEVKQLEETAQDDAALVLLTGEWRALLRDVMHAFSPNPANIPAIAPSDEALERVE